MKNEPCEPGHNRKKTINLYYFKFFEAVNISSYTIYTRSIFSDYRLQAWKRKRLQIFKSIIQTNPRLALSNQYFNRSYLHMQHLLLKIQNQKVWRSYLWQFYLPQKLQKVHRFPCLQILQFWALLVLVLWEEET